MNYGNRFKRYRLHKGYSQKEAAELIGIKNYQLGNYETNRSEPSIDILKKMSVIYEVSIDRLVNNVRFKSETPLNEDDKRIDMDEILKELNEMVEKINNSKEH